MEEEIALSFGKRLLGWAAQNALPIIAVLLLLGLVASQLHSCSAKQEAKLNQNVADASVQAGKNAVETVSQAGARETQIIDHERVIEHEVRSAQGADAPVAPAANDAGLAGLCSHATYSGTEQCMSRADTAGLAQAGSGSTTPSQ